VLQRPLIKFSFRTVYLRLKVYGGDPSRVTAMAKRSKLTHLCMCVCVCVCTRARACVCALQYLCATTHSALLRWRPPSDLGAGPEEPVKIVEFRIQSGNTEAEKLASMPIVSVS
jgi:hypothetical protein